MNSDNESGGVFDSTLLASLQEGENWLSVLEKELGMIEADIVASQGLLSEVGIASLIFSMEKTKDAIEQVSLEMMMLNE